jgi:ABC-2 type transport system permease protein
MKSRGLGSLIYNTYRFTKYPLNLFGKGIQVFLTFIIPFAFASFYPAAFFLRKDEALLFGDALRYATPFVGIVLFGLAYKFWKFSLSRYESSGS